VIVYLISKLSWDGEQACRLTLKIVHIRELIIEMGDLLNRIFDLSVGYSCCLADRCSASGNRRICVGKWTQRSRSVHGLLA
jgi:hypothetical protein